MGTPSSVSLTRTFLSATTRPGFCLSIALKTVPYAPIEWTKNCIRTFFADPAAVEELQVDELRGNVVENGKFDHILP